MFTTSKLQIRSQHPSEITLDKKSNQESKEASSFMPLALHHNAPLLHVMGQQCSTPQLIHDPSLEGESESGAPIDWAEMLRSFAILFHLIASNIEVQTISNFYQ